MRYSVSTDFCVLRILFFIWTFWFKRKVFRIQSHNRLEKFTITGAASWKFSYSQGLRWDWRGIPTCKRRKGGFRCKHAIIQPQKTIATNRHILKTIIDVLLLCSRQNIPIRGHTEDRSNFLAILGEFAKRDPVLRTFDPAFCAHFWTDLLFPKFCIIFHFFW